MPAGGALRWAAVICLPIALAVLFPKLEEGVSQAVSSAFSSVGHVSSSADSEGGHDQPPADPIDPAAEPPPAPPVGAGLGAAPPADGKGKGGMSSADEATPPPSKKRKALPFNIWWFAPFLSGGGYSSEAIGFATALAGLPKDVKKKRLWLSQHGDALSQDHLDGLTPSDAAVLKYHMGLVQPGKGGLGASADKAVVICHSEPGAWSVPKPLYQTSHCPPGGVAGSLFVIGRTMFETDRLTEEHVERCNKMHEIWVPTEFHVETFAGAGVARDKLRAVPEPVDVAFFDPDKYEAFSLAKLSSSRRVFGPEAWIGDEGCVLLSVFKWEARKGWDVLLRAYLSEFTAEDDVALYLLTSPYHGQRNFLEQMRNWAAENMGPEPEQGWPRVHVIDRHLPSADLPRLIKAARAMVLPTRGEGWGRPHVEAMSMGVPVIATDWSGPTAYLTESNGYPLEVEGLDEITEGFMKGHKWARPSVPHLRKLMRRVLDLPMEAADRGRQAREDMVAGYSPAAVGRIVVEELRRVEAKLREQGARLIGGA